MPGYARTLQRILVLCGLYAGAALAQETVVPAGPPSPPPTALAPAMAKVLMHTTLGDIRLEIEIERAPITARNFLRYVELKRFDGINFYRAVKLDAEGKYGMVQGGVRSAPKLALGAIAHEPHAVTGLSHLDGAISMASLGPGTARGDFFIVVGDLVSLDGNGTPADPGYAVFGRVSDGMAIVRNILEMPRSDAMGDGSMKGQMLADPVKILTVRREK
ncbi:MAG: peptidylprolyl isomerase [Steroidobacteraceae bacterium]